MATQLKLATAGALLCGVVGVWYPKLFPADDASQSAEPYVPAHAVVSTHGGSGPSRTSDEGAGTEAAAVRGARDSEGMTRDLLDLARDLRGTASAPPLALASARASQRDVEEGAPELVLLEPEHPIATFLREHRLTGTLVAEGSRVAVIDGRLLREGDVLLDSGARLLEVEPRSARFVLDGRAFVLEMEPFRVPARGASAPSVPLDDEDPMLLPEDQ